MDNFQKERDAFYKTIPQYWPNLYDEEYSLFDVKLDSNERIQQIRTATKRVGHIFRKVTPLLQQMSSESLSQLGFPSEAIAYVRLSTSHLITLIGRMDFVVSGKTIKLLELNSDTPTFIKETFNVNNKICDYFHQQTANEGLEELLSKALRKGIHEAWNNKENRPPVIVFTSHDDHVEDYYTTKYLQELCGLPSSYFPLAKLKVLSEDIVENGEVLAEKGLYTPDGERIDVLYRPTYPIEHLVEDLSTESNEKIGETLLCFVEEGHVTIMNPPSSFLLQSKAVQAVIWGLFEEDHPYFNEEEKGWISQYFLPTYLESDPFIVKKEKFVRKPAFGREGDTVVIYNEFGEKVLEDQQKTYENSLFVYQQFMPLPQHNIRTEKGMVNAHIMYGSFYVHHTPMAIGIRAGGPITDNRSYFLPVAITKRKGMS
ncbi:glutathionylspermidine synthase family protein [Bacillus spongiae]|uniref:Glutathionylspermidine synthase family protein n=1 Tax=Bacillus spongiae TaxID=2683610 RepID=A0ABU8HGH0_9BACI